VIAWIFARQGACGLAAASRAMRTQPHRRVFIDEMAVKTNLTHLRGRAAVGERLFGPAPFGR